MDVDRRSGIKAYPAWTCALALALSACAGQAKKDEVNPNIYPTDFKDVILEYVRTLGDPTGIRGAFLAPPALRQLGRDSRYVVCVRYDAKETGGRYAGSKDYAAIFYAGSLNQYVEATAETCGGAAYQPFPELERLKRLGD